MLGLVLEGGAHRTIFSCGVLDAFLDAGIRADYIIGASAGITYGVSYASGQKGRNREMLRRFVRKPAYMGMLHRLNPSNQSYYNLKYVFDTIPNSLLPFHYDVFQAWHGRAVAAVTNIVTGEPEYLDVPRNDPTWQVLRATCALPLLFKPITIDGCAYADGGVADSIPYEQALRDGCDKLIVILTRERSYRKSEEKMMNLSAGLFRKKYPAYADTMLHRHEHYNACIDRIAQLERSGELFVIAPESTLGVSRTEKNISALMSLYAQGYAMAVQLMPALKQYLCTGKDQDYGRTEI